MLSKYASTLAFTSLISSEGDTCPQNDHLVEKLPLFDGQFDLCNYAGTFEVAKDHHLFYWFFRNEKKDAPLLLFLNGGPGASSMMGLFMENGPLRVKDEKFIKAEKTWTDDYHVLYLDQPVGSGFSYTESDLQTDMEGIGKEFLEFMHQFFDKYPEMKERDLYYTGESYAGKYLSYFTYETLENTDFNLKALWMCDPLPSPMYERTEMHVLPAAHGIIDEINLEQVALLEQRCWAEFAKDTTNSGYACNDVMSYIQDVSGGVAWYDSRLFDETDVKPYKNAVTDILKKQEVLDALHLSESTRKPKFGLGSKGVKDAIKGDLSLDYSRYYNYMLEKKFPFIVMVGEFDMQDGYHQQMKWMKEMLNTDIWYESPRQIYYLDDGRVGGYF